MIVNSIVKTFSKEISTLMPFSNKFTYFSLIDKPIESLALNSIAQASCQLIQFGFNELTLTPQFSCVLGGFLFRIGTQAFTSFFASMKSRYPQKLLINKWIEKAFLVDFRRDCQFQNFTEEYREKLSKHYTIGAIIRNIVNSYMILNFFRGCHYAIYSQRFSHFLQNTQFVAALDLYDQNFIIPVAIIGLNYLMLKNSEHPFLLKISKPQNSLYAFNLAFMGGIFFLPFSTIYQFSYIGVILGHLAIRKCTSLQQKIVIK